MRRLVIIAATTLIAVGMLSAPAEAKKAKNCSTEAWCLTGTPDQPNQTKRDKRGNDWEVSGQTGHHGKKA